MQGRPHAQRLEKDLGEIRNELATEVGQLKPEELGWAPQPGMKTYRALLQEIGTMEQLCARWLT
jgi:hypothetical protein